MRVTIVVTPEGKISAITREGTFREGKERLLDLLAALRREGVDLPPVPDRAFEQHRHGPAPAGVRGSAGAC